MAWTRRRHLFLHSENQDRRNKSEAFQEIAVHHFHPPCQTDEVKNLGFFGSQRHLCLQKSSLSHSHTLFFCSSVEFPLDFVLLCSKGKEALYLMYKMCSLCRDSSAVKIHQAVQSVSLYDTETCVQWGSMKQRAYIVYLFFTYTTVQKFGITQTILCLP